MDNHTALPGRSSDRDYHGVLIKNDQFLVTADDDLIRLRPLSKESPVREFSRSKIFDSVPEIDTEGLPSLALAIHTSGGIKRMVLSFPPGAGGTDARDRLLSHVVGIINGAHSSEVTGSKEALKVISGILIKGSRFRIGIGSAGITLTPESGGGSVREFSRPSLVDVSPERNTTGHPALTLGITTKSGTQKMILSFPKESGGSAARDQTLGLIQGIIRGTGTKTGNKSVGPVCSVAGFFIKDVPFDAELSPDRITLTPRAGEGGSREFGSDLLFDIVPEFTPDGIQSAVLAIRTATGIRRMILCFPEESGGAEVRDHFIGLVRGIINGTLTSSVAATQGPRRDPGRAEYPICQRSGLMSGDGEVGLLLTSKRFIIYGGGGREVSVREEFRSQQILDASPTIDLSGRPAMTVSIISPEKEILCRSFIFDDMDERNRWISLLTADELPPPMIEEADDEVITPAVVEAEEDEVPDDEPQNPPDEEERPPSNRCPLCGTILPPDSPWCDLCGVRLTAERDARVPGESDLIHTDDPFGAEPQREYGRLLTFLIAPSGAGRFEDDPIQIPILFFLISMLVCILGNLSFIAFLLSRTYVDPSLYPVLTELTTDPVVSVIFIMTLLSAAVLSVLIASLIAYLITGRVEGSPGKIIKITLYAALPFAVAGLIPLIGVLLAGFWSIFVLSGALRRRFDFSFSASLFPPIISYGAAFIAIFLLTGGLF
jgi:hypothetical protein